MAMQPSSLRRSAKALSSRGSVGHRRRAHALDLGELAAEQAEQVEHVDALVEEMPPPTRAGSERHTVGVGGIGSLAVHAAQPEDPAVLGAVDDLLGFHDAEVVAVVEAELENGPGIALLRGDDPLDVLYAAARRLLAEDVLAGVERRTDDIGSEPVGRADEHGVDVGVDHGLSGSRPRCRRSPRPEDSGRLRRSGPCRRGPARCWRECRPACRDRRCPSSMAQTCSSASSTMHLPALWKQSTVADWRLGSARRRAAFRSVALRHQRVGASTRRVLPR